MAPNPILRRKREALIREHMDSENRHEFDATLDTFHHPRYELVATGDVYDGPEEVMGYFEESRTAFPDQRNELLALHHADDAVIVEFDLLGTNTGSLRGLPPTGKEHRTRMTAFFFFDPAPGGRIVCERVYFDTLTTIRQLGIAREPLSLMGKLETVVSHPLTIARGVVRQVTKR